MKNNPKTKNLRNYFCPKLETFSDELPHTRHALSEPDGLLAFGGSLEVEEIVANYKRGAFPWFTEDEPVIWWSPSRRLCLFPQNLKISRSLRKKVNHTKFLIKINKDFEQVINKCSSVKDRLNNTWITNKIKQAYIRLYKSGYAYSVECWKGTQMVGGLYGVSIGRIFFGESMFALETDASKLALVALCTNNVFPRYHLIDCQIESEHLKSLGANLISRSDFERRLTRYCQEQPGIIPINSKIR